MSPLSVDDVLKVFARPIRRPVVDDDDFFAEANGLDACEDLADVAAPVVNGMTTEIFIVDNSRRRVIDGQNVDQRME